MSEENQAIWMAISENRANIAALSQRSDRFEANLAATLIRMESKLDTLNNEVTEMRGKFKGGWLVIAALGATATALVTIFVKLLGK